MIISVSDSPTESKKKQNIFDEKKTLESEELTINCDINNIQDNKELQSHKSDQTSLSRSPSPISPISNPSLNNNQKGIVNNLNSELSTEETSKNLKRNYSKISQDDFIK